MKLAVFVSRSVIFDSFIISSFIIAKASDFSQILSTKKPDSPRTVGSSLVKIYSEALLLLASWFLAEVPEAGALSCALVSASDCFVLSEAESVCC